MNSLAPSPTSSLAPNLSLAKDKIRVLLLEGVHDSAVALLHRAGYSQIERVTKALDGDALRQAVQGVHSWASAPART